MSSAVPSGPPPASPTPAPAPTTPTTAAGAPALVTAEPLPVSPGQALAARVLSVRAGAVELALAGGLVTAASDLPLEPGQTLRLVVGETSDRRVTLRLQHDAATAGGPPAGGGRGTPAGALAAAGVPPSAAGALLAALVESGQPLPTGAAAGALAARTAAAGVTTPAAAAAFARLEAAGLPATPAAVAGLARLLEGAPLGRALAGLLEGAARGNGGPGTGSTGGGAAPPAPAPGTAGGGAPAPVGGGGAITAGGPTTASGAPADWPSTVRPNGTAPQVPVPMGPASPAPNWATDARPSGTTSATGGPAPVATAPSPPPLPALVAALADLARGVGSDATSGRGELLRRAIADLGVGLEARLAAGDPPDAAPLRALLHAVAAHPASDAAVARAAAGIADGISAQALAGSAVPVPGAAAPDASQQGAYLQVPLPGGGTAEIRVPADGAGGGADDPGRPRRLAFLLHLPALGPVMIDATAGRDGVDATIRPTRDDARLFLAPRAAELAEALRRSVPAASVSVERPTPGPAPERLLAPPPPSGLDLSA